MKRVYLLGACLVGFLLWKVSSIGDVPAKIELPPQNLGLHIALLRFAPTQKERDKLVQPFRQWFDGAVEKSKLQERGLTYVIEVLSAYGAVDVLHRSDRDVILAPDSKVRFDALEERPVVLLGNKDALPPTPKFGLTLEVTTKPLESGKFTLSWTGSLKWSPQLIDRWQFHPEQFLSFAAKAGAVAKDLMDKKHQDPLDIGLKVGELFSSKDSGPTAGQLWELPVVKEVAFQSSRVCRDQELNLNSTVSEVGGLAAQAIILVMLPRLNP
jgi:hypothetical protein